MHKVSAPLKARLAVFERLTFRNAASCCTLYGGMYTRHLLCSFTFEHYEGDIRYKDPAHDLGAFKYRSPTSSTGLISNSTDKETFLTSAVRNTVPFLVLCICSGPTRRFSWPVAAPFFSVAASAETTLAYSPRYCLKMV